jgi:hypothetical protein
MNPLFAAIDFHVVVRIIVLLLIFVVPLVGQLIAKFRQIPPPGQRPLPPRPAPPDVADEIEEFLTRRAVQRPPAKVEQPGKIQPLSPQAAQPVKAEVVAEGEKPVGGQVTAHVKQYLDEQAFDRREAELGQKVAQADQQIDQHLQQVFSHPVSKLEAVPGEAAKPTSAYEPPNLVGTSEDVPDSFATGLLDLLTTPDSLRQAIILNEILHRPEERWA